MPKASRPNMPEGYLSKGKTGMLRWHWLDERMAKALNYWVATTCPDGRPHVMPVWGVWLHRRFYFGTHPQTRKARNLKANPQIAVHLESADEVVIVEGTIEEVRGKSLVKQINEAYLAKYQMPSGHGEDDAPMYCLQPRVAFAWEVMTINRSATRWLFDD
ncbi:MAG: pyridoxamine 5'-phosphate oxidase family protein [Acidobacteria bacterium]|nr:pyridoxamine 5'-phosphate oxidase family protein [Acidobacteriota bacterium]